MQALAKGLQSEELQELNKSIAKSRAGLMPPSTFVRSANRMGNRDLALDWLEKSYAHRDYWELFINVDPEI